MPRALRKEFPGAKYHVASRGNGKRHIFHSDADRQRFLRQLEDALDYDQLVLYAYALMPNHYHLLVETKVGNLGQFMHRLNTAYAAYYSHRYKEKHAGSVFQHGYKSPLVEGDDYLVRLTRYIHLNPVKTRTMKGRPESERIGYLSSYRWSSYLGYVDKAEEEEMVRYRWRSLIGGRSRAEQRRRYQVYAESMVSETDEGLLEAMDASVYAIGDDEFVEGVEDEITIRSVGDESDVVIPERDKVTVEDIDNAVCQVYGCEKSDLRKHGHAAGEAKRVALELVCRLGGLNNRNAGREYGGITGAGVGYQRRVMSDLLKQNAAVRMRYKRTCRQVGC